MDRKVYSQARGSALIIAILALAAVVTLGLGVAKLAPRDYQQSASIEDSLAAEQAAWAGIEEGMLLIKNNPNEELTASSLEPYSAVPDSCLQNPSDAQDCGATNRLVGNPVNVAPVLSTSGTFPWPGHDAKNVKFGLAIWYRKHTIGNPNSATDGLLAQSPNDTSNINAVLQKDEVRSYTVNAPEASSGVNIYWQPYGRSSAGDTVKCQYQNGDPQLSSKYALLFTSYDKNGQVVTRKSVPSNGSWLASKSSFAGSDLARAVTYSLRLIVTGDSGVDNSGCYARYAIEDSKTDETTDMGFSVIQATGYSGNVQRTIQVLVDRHNLRLLNVFDFGVITDALK